MLQDITVLLEHEPEELSHIVRDQIDFQPVVDAGFLNSLGPRGHSDDFTDRQNVSATEIEIGIV